MTLRDRVAVLQQDITTLAVDAIANAANSSLLGGGGVDGAIHRAAGPELAAYCRNLNGCKTGDAKISPGFRLAAKWVIHAVGPVWNGGAGGEDALLASCYRNAMRLAESKDCRTVAFPSISTGIYGFPIERAARIAVTQVKQALVDDLRFEKVYHVCFSADDAAVYQKAVDEIYS
ncbi:MAG: O-acetyl-ADP-ribose deacetylase [Acidobacteriota bacterium]|nr:O-acetyl-ADP-ribose deacetylase [Acidobacteriota bacterium]